MSELLTEMSREVIAIANERNVKTDGGIVSVIKEVNQKWNALCKIYEKEYGCEVLVRNGFVSYWKHRIPELNNVM